MRRSKATDVLVALAVGVGVGALLGVLLAPQSGEETIDYLRKNASDRFDDAVRAGKNIARKAQGGMAQAKDYVNDAAETGRNKVSRVQDQVQDRVEQFKDSAQDIADAGQRAYREARNS